MIADIEDFTTAALLAEIVRRKQCHVGGVCWYCKQPYTTHTCKHAVREIDAKWTITTRIIRDEGRDSNLPEYWRAIAEDSTGDRVAANGCTKDDAIAAVKVVCSKPRLI